MNKSTLIIMGGALVVAIIVAMLVQMKFAPSSKDEKAAVESTKVLIANKTLLTGELIKEENTHWEDVPDTMLFKGMIKKKDQDPEEKSKIFGKPLRRNVESGEPVTMQALVADAEGEGNFLSATINKSKRAISVPVKAETSVGGFISPGDYVDVIVTYQLSSMKGDATNYATLAIQKYASETVLSNVRVLAVDQNSKENGHEAKIVKTVTLEVSKVEAQTLAMATSMGQITLALRRLGEKDTEADKNVPLTTDVTTSKVIQKIYGIMNQSKTTASSVRVYNGANVSNMPVRLGTTGQQK